MTTLRTWARAVRVHQWSKNGLLLLPALAAHLAPEGPTLLALAAGVLSFSFLASAVYLLNDIADLEHDRAHPTKRRRPIASGEIGVRAALVAMGVLSALSLVIALRLPLPFLGAWLAYLALTTAYSFALKRRVVVDVVVLAALYTVRVIAGATAVSVSLSRWFLAFSVFLFMSLALLKRLVETRGTDDRGGDALAGRGWRVADRPVLLGFGMASSVAAALVYCLYITGDQLSVLYSRPDLLWAGLPLLLYWLARVWLLAERGEVDEDPVVFAIQDAPSYVVAVLFALTVVAAS